MAYTQGNLFDMLGIDFDEMAAGTKKKPEKKTKSSSKKTVKKSKSALIKLPVTVYTGYAEPFVIDIAAVGKAEISEEELKKEIAKKVSSLSVSSMAMDGKNGKYYVSVKETDVIAKGTVKATADTKLIMPDGQTGPSLSTIMSDTTCEISLDEIEKMLADVNGLRSGVKLKKRGEDYIVIPDGESLEQKQEIVFPVTIEAYGRNPVVITPESYAAFMKEQGNDTANYDYKMMVEMFLRTYPDFEGHLILKKVKDNPKVLTAKISIQDSAKNRSKTNMYPTDVTVSFAGVNRVELSAEMFDGKTEITEDELIDWCHSLYPEFKKGRVVINYFKDDNLIIPMIKGSTKGAGYENGLRVAENYEEFSEEEQKGLPFLFRTQDSNQTFRVESNIVSLTMAAMERAYMDTGKYLYRLPKISGKIWCEMDYFFRHIAEIYGTEIMFRIFWNKRAETYELEMPVQRVTAGSVQEDSEDKDGVLRKPDCIAVAEFHSHGFYNAFFSIVDNEDELGNKVYGVMGGYSNSQSKALMRAGTGGKYVMIKKSDVFTDETATQEELDAFVQKWAEKAEQVVTFG